MHISKKSITFASNFNTALKFSTKIHKIFGCKDTTKNSNTQIKFMFMKKIQLVLAIALAVLVNISMVHNIIEVNQFESWMIPSVALCVLTIVLVKRLISENNGSN